MLTDKRIEECKSKQKYQDSKGIEEVIELMEVISKQTKLIEQQERFIEQLLEKEKNNKIKEGTSNYWDEYIEDLERKAKGLR